MQAPIAGGEVDERIALLFEAGGHDLSDEQGVIPAWMSLDEATVEVGDRAVEDRRPRLRLVPGRGAEAAQLGRGGGLGEALRDAALPTGEHADGEGVTLDDPLVRLAPRVDAGHHQWWVHADGRDRIGCLAR